MSKYLGLIIIAILLTLCIGIQLGMRAGMDIAARQSDAEYIEQYLAEH
jgi:hypothetical protein